MRKKKHLEAHLPLYCGSSSVVGFKTLVPLPCTVAHPPILCLVCWCQGVCLWLASPLKMKRKEIMAAFPVNSKHPCKFFKLLFARERFYWLWCFRWLFPLLLLLRLHTFVCEICLTLMSGIKRIVARDGKHLKVLCSNIPTKNKRGTMTSCELSWGRRWNSLFKIRRKQV